MSETRFRSDDGIDLVADVHGPESAPPVILLHGGGQTRHAWKTTAQGLARQGYRAIAADLRGHGDSGWSGDGTYSLARFVADLRLVAASCRQPPVLIGASLGGVTGLLAEGEGPALLSALILVDVTPTVRFAGVDRIREFMGARADDGFASVEAAADAIAAYLPHRQRPRSLDGLRRNLRRRPDGRYRWHWDPPSKENRVSKNPPVAAAPVSVVPHAVSSAASQSGQPLSVDRFVISYVR
jgi:pimeloyl-ACP methyl ester carboxylesterase